MNPEDTFTESDVKEDIARIIDKDSRVELINITLISSGHAIRAEVELRYVILNSEDTLFLEFKNEQQV